MGIAPKRNVLGSNLENVSRILQAADNEIRARFDLLTSFRQGEHSVDEWYNAV